MRIAQWFSVYVFLILSPMTLGQSHDIGRSLMVGIDNTDTVVVVNKDPNRSSAFKNRIRLSETGVAKNLILFNDDFYLIDKTGNLFRMSRSKSRITALNFMKVMTTTAALGVGMNIGLYIGGASPPVIETVPWLIAIPSLTALLPPAAAAKLPFFDGADFFTEKLDSKVQSIFRTRTENYEIIFEDNRKNKLLTTYPIKNPDPFTCESWLARFW